MPHINYRKEILTKKSSSLDRTEYATIILAHIVLVSWTGVNGCCYHDDVLMMRGAKVELMIPCTDGVLEGDLLLLGKVLGEVYGFATQ